MRFQKTLFLVTISIILLIVPYFHVDGETNNLHQQIVHEIQMTQDKYVAIDQHISETRVCYWTHVIESIIVKNDYILIHENNYGEIIEYQRQWSDVSMYNFSDIDYKPLTIPFTEIAWIEKVVFINQDDCTGFYTFHKPQEFPVFCYEVRYLNGETILMDTEAKKIGSGVPAPSKGFSLTGYCEDYSPDCWIAWRQNADLWYQNWVDSTTSISLPTPQTISSYISDPETTLFYELAHGASSYFQAHQQGTYYYASDVEDAMIGREKMTFAFIGSCEGMTHTDDDTFSYEFRKGELTDTTTIGYSGMGSCPGWSVSLEWQDTMFYAMNSGYTIKEAFDYANLQYPTIADCVVFVGDPTMTIHDDPDNGNDIEVIPPNILITSPKPGSRVAGSLLITGTAKDLDGLVEHVYIAFDDEEWESVSGTVQWHHVLDTTGLSNGIHQIKAIAVDDEGIQSGIYRLEINVSNGQLHLTSTIPPDAYVNEPVQFFGYASGGMPPYQFIWDFGDGTGSYDQNPSHAYATPGFYDVTVTLRDDVNTTEEQMKTIIIKQNDSYPPIIRMIYPKHGWYLNNKSIISSDRLIILGPIEIEISVIDGESNIKSIEWYLNDQPIPTNTPIVHKWSWTTSYFGYFQLQIYAEDSWGNQGEYTISGFKFF